ncbi:hypothetical protein PanWU01x14_278420 [Parasponia andersonii]|uniref:Uncharacterized protein n=1 Tax=Parasponia andersonii TaxID=3476 RepID=A0A2P5B243_PARAD|nr:hypothetical protein PanWU01x14_278420 [Parasponia andersonii]
MTCQLDFSNKQPASSSFEAPNIVDKDQELLPLLCQLPEKAALSMAFIDRFTFVEGYEKMKKGPPKITFHAVIRMLAYTTAAVIFTYDPIIECMKKEEKFEKMTKSCEDLKRTYKQEKNDFETERKQLQEDLAKEQREKVKLKKKIKELEDTIS